LKPLELCMALGSYIQFNAQVRDGTGSRVSNLGPGRVGSRVKAMTRLFDPDSCSMLPSISLRRLSHSAQWPISLYTSKTPGQSGSPDQSGSLAFRVGSGLGSVSLTGFHVWHRYKQTKCQCS